MHLLNEKHGGTLEFLSKIDNIYYQILKTQKRNPFSKKPNFTLAFCSRYTVGGYEIG